MTGNQPHTGASVIVCCCNSAKRLPDTLRFLALQKTPENFSVEIIIVNNNSNDETAEVAISEWNKYNSPFHFSVVHEATPGLIHARLCGVSQAANEILIFCDDDNWLHENYISTAYEVMQQHPNVAVLGGKSEGRFESSPPAWFNKFSGAYAIGNPLPHSGIANDKKYIAGAGMVMRKSFFKLLEEKKFQPILTGRMGQSIASGEDSELCLMALYMGFDLYYDDRLFFYHFITAKRLSWKYCAQMKAKGHALPQVYFALYDYCYQQITAGKEIKTKEAFRRIWYKPYKVLGRNCKTLKGFFTTIRCLLFSVEGSSKEIEIKAQLNKLRYYFSNKKLIASNLFKMENNLRQSLKQHETAITE